MIKIANECNGYIYAGLRQKTKQCRPHMTLTHVI
jgi:hypothetical protein